MRQRKMGHAPPPAGQWHAPQWEGNRHLAEVVEVAGRGGLLVNRAQSSDDSTMAVTLRPRSVMMRMASPGWIS